MAVEIGHDHVHVGVLWLIFIVRMIQCGFNRNYCVSTVEGQRDCITEIERSERDDNRSHPSSADVKNEWSCTSTSPIFIHGVDADNY